MSDSEIKNLVVSKSGDTVNETWTEGAKVVQEIDRPWLGILHNELNTREQAIKDALIKLGWLPPEARCKSCRHGLGLSTTEKTCYNPVVNEMSESDDAAIIRGGAGVGVAIRVGPEFGCTHWSKKV